MNNPVLVIYDSTGKVWGIYAGVETLPTGITGVMSDMPEEFTSIIVNPTTGEVTWGNDPVETPDE